MAEELRFAVRCFGSSKKPAKKKPNKTGAANPLDGPNGTLTPLTTDYTTEYKSANHYRQQYGIPDQYT